MGYTPENNPYIPGDPYSYDLKWIVKEVKKIRKPEEEAAKAEAAALAAAESELNAKNSADNAAISEENAENSANSANASALAAADYVSNIADPVSGIVVDWLNDNITQPTTPIVDTSLSIAGAAADAKVTGDNFNLNARTFGIEDSFDTSTVTTSGITFSYSSGRWSVSGLASGQALKILYPATNFISGISENDILFVNFNSNNRKITLRIIFRNAANVETGRYVVSIPRFITVPENSDKWTISIMVNSGQSIDSGSYIENIAFLNSATNKYLSETKDTLASGTDINSVFMPGRYLMSASESYTNSPMAYVGAELEVEVPEQNWLIQTITTTKGGIFKRRYASGSWSTWENVNFYPYNPANSNITSEIQYFLNNYQYVKLGSGRFITTGLNVGYGTLEGCGESTILQLDDNVATGAAVTLDSFGTVNDLRISGGSAVLTPDGNIIDRHGILYRADADQVNPTLKYRTAVSNVYITGFEGGGITCDNTGLSPKCSMLIDNCRIYNCNVGINIPYYSEYHRISNCSITACWYGCIDNGGNNNFTNCDFSDNTQALLIDNGSNQSPNPAHGSFTGCSFNHSDNNNGTAIEILGAYTGEIFTGCQIFFGKIIIDNSVGIRFVANNFGRQVPITVTNSTVVTFDNSTFYDSSSSPVTASGNTACKFTECYLRDGTSYAPTM